MKTLKETLGNLDSEMVRPGVVVFGDTSTGKYNVNIEVPSYYIFPDTMSKEEAMLIAKKINRHSHEEIEKLNLVTWENLENESK